MAEQESVLEWVEELQQGLQARVQVRPSALMPPRLKVNDKLIMTATRKNLVLLFDTTSTV